MEVKDEKSNFEMACNVLLNIFGILLIIYTTAYFLIALTD